MRVDLEVAEPIDGQDHSFGELDLYHRDCGALAKHRSPISDEYILRCKCGLELAFPQTGTAATAIFEASVDELVHELQANSFKCNRSKYVRISPRGEHPK